jgi:hypothetical protein
MKKLRIRSNKNMRDLISALFYYKRQNNPPDDRTDGRESLYFQFSNKIKF